MLREIQNADRIEAEGMEGEVDYHIAGAYQFCHSINWYPSSSCLLPSISSLFNEQMDWISDGEI